ncbi:AAA family ATPase [Jannaschia sp. M317]|uniref:AAA family ATPase n=1 Tax=Jannaschia sp. M317 TaxID=2867011 RepID=UPI0021A7D2FB|nr:AAA family ATPase [Jannaschia sp. M317]UWQ17532.1 AAA family ATPase [Jannaschia sp. M317]
MASNLAQLPEPDPLRAVTVSRDVQEFDLLIEDMEAELGEGWGDLSFAEAITFLRQDEARELEFIVIAADKEDEAQLPLLLDVTRQAKRAGLSVILIAEGLGPMTMHEMLRAGADDFAPYPLPENALAEAVARIRTQAPPGASDALLKAGSETVESTVVPASPTGGGNKTEAALFAIQSAAGGNGASTVAVNLAWELANLPSEEAPSVILIDLGLQFGSVGTYLDLARKSSTYDVLTDIGSMDEQAFKQSLTPYRDKLQVFTAPAEVLPLDVIGPDEVSALLKLARACFDVVIVDMPGAMTGWTETVLKTADIYFICCELEVRSAQNTLRFQRLLQGEGIAMDHVAYLLNRAPGKLDMTGRGRIDKFSESLDLKFHAVLPDGGKQVTEVNDQASPLRELAARNGLTKEIAKLAKDLQKIREEVEGKAAAKAKGPAKKKAIFGLQFG